MNLEIGGFQRDGWVTMNAEKADIKHDLNKFPYPMKKSSVDKILMLHTLEHLDDPFKVMQEIYRIAKPDAVVTIEVPYWKSDQYTNPVHKHCFKPQWFRSLTPKSRKFRNMESWCPCEFEVIKEEWKTGKHAFWRKYAFSVQLRVVKC
jgi:ubiquinone/menaquinone biosynthesis C-methylase UbiE